MQDDNKIIVGGLSTNGSGKLQFALARLTITGGLDNTFGFNCIKEHDLYAAFNQLNDFVAAALDNDAGPLIIPSATNTGICPGSNTTFSSNVTGAAYHWQVDNDNGIFTNLVNVAPYSTVATNTLNLTAPVTALYGYKYRCMVNGNTYSQTFTLKFASNWTGLVSNAWEASGNWNCSAIPDANTDVYISTGKPNYPLVNSTRYARSIHLQNGTTLGVSTSQRLTVTGNN